MADLQQVEPTETCSLVEVKTEKSEKVLAKSGISANLTRNTRVVSDRVIFVDNIADFLTKDEFIDIVSKFAQKGAIVDVKFLKRTKGSSFAFVEYEFEDDGRSAIQALNKRDFTTNSGKVLELRASKAENPTEAVSNKNLYVKGLPKHWTNEDLKRRFARFGSISHCRTLKQPGSHENTGVGFVHFFSTLDAANAIEEVDEKLAYPEDPSSNILEVKFARAKKPRSKNRYNNNNRRNNYRNDETVPGGYGQMPNWNFGRSAGRNGGRNIRQHGGGMYPPSEGQGTPEVWAKMVEIMHNMSMWQNPYANTNYGGNYYPPNGNNYYSRENSSNGGDPLNGNARPPPGMQKEWFPNHNSQF